MSGVVMRRLGDVVEFLDHLRRPIKSSDRVPGDIPYYGANGQQDSVSGFIFDETLVLLAEDGGHFDNPDRSIAYLIEGKSWVNNHAHVIRCLGQIDPCYLVRLLGPMDVSVYLSGSTRPKLTKGQAALIELPLPPLDEQRRIAETLDTADGIRRRHLRARDEAKALLAALSAREFTRLEEAASVPKVRLGDVVEFLDHLRRPIKSSDRVPGDIPYYGANGQQDSVSGFIFDETLVLLAEDGGHFDNPDRSIAYLIEGKSWVNNHAHVIRCLGQIDPCYLVRLLGPMDVSVYLSGSTRPKLTKGQAALIELPLPPLDEQRRIADTLDAADSLARRHQAAADDAAALLASLSHDIFTRLEQEASRESA